MGGVPLRQSVTFNLNVVIGLEKSKHSFSNAQYAYMYIPMFIYIRMYMYMASIITIRKIIASESFL